MAQREAIERTVEVPARVTPSVEEFCELRREFEMAVVSTEVSSDLLTPVAAFMQLRDGPCFLLESAESSKMWGRYSFLGFRPVLIARLDEGSLRVSDSSGERVLGGDPVRALVQLVEGSRVHAPRDGMPFGGGAVGYLGYDIFKYLERVHVTRRPEAIPEAMFMVPGRMVAFDHLRSRIRVGVLAAVPDELGACRASYASAIRALEEMLSSLEEPTPAGRRIQLGVTSRAPSPGATTQGPDCPKHSGALTYSARPNVTAQGFERMVAGAREHILAGDAFQVVVSARFEMPFEGDPLSIYRHLRADNPSPYMFHIELPGFAMVGSSPEPMVTNRGGRALIRPIAGTRRRGASSAEDAALAQELVSDPKERAEHIMLVDLARNDLGRLCVPGSVEVSRLMEVEQYSHVMHLVSEVTGVLREGSDNYDLLRSVFPAGTVSGAPKVRACEIIEELEPEGRGPYAGAVGYLGYAGELDTCIAIRTAVVAGGFATVQAGAGIVADSVPKNEWNEVLNKASAVIKAVEAAGPGACPPEQEGCSE